MMMMMINERVLSDAADSCVALASEPNWPMLLVVAHKHAKRNNRVMGNDKRDRAHFDDSQEISLDAH